MADGGEYAHVVRHRHANHKGLQRRRWPPHISKMVRNYMLDHQWYNHSSLDLKSRLHLHNLYCQVRRKFRSDGGRLAWNDRHDELLWSKLENKIGTERRMMLRDGILVTE